MIDRNRFVFSAGILRHFINNCFEIDIERHRITGFELCPHLFSASSHNTYLETVGDKADTVYLRAKQSSATRMMYAYLNHMKRISPRFEWKKKNFILAFDYTDENFYGDVQGFHIHGFTGKDGVTGKFKFLTCSIVSDEIPQKIPLITVPIRLGHYKSHVISYCLSQIEELIGNIKLILFDRGFYDKDLMYELGKASYPYLIFVPKHSDKKKVLLGMKDKETKSKIHKFEFRKNGTKYEGKDTLVFLKQIYDPKSEKNYDWVFETNVKLKELDNIIITYKKRWRIETGFRVQDEATIKCKSKNMLIRYFLFLFEQMLQNQWMCFYKDDISFKKFIIQMEEIAADLAAHPEKSRGKPRKLLSQEV